MPSFQEIKRVPWSAQEMYDLVADAEKYPEFITWVRHVEKEMISEYEHLYTLHVGLGPIREKFTTIDIFTPHSSIDIKLKSGPLSKLQNVWRFRDLPEGGSEVEFSIDFEFNNRFLAGAMNKVFHQAQQMMIRNFEKRAKAIYG